MASHATLNRGLKGEKKLMVKSVKAKVKSRKGPEAERHLAFLRTGTDKTQCGWALSKWELPRASGVMQLMWGNARHHSPGAS